MAYCSTEPLTDSVWRQEEDEEEKEPKSQSDDSESEPEPPLASNVRRKVSFADAFGLDLVSVKEFDNRIEKVEGREREEFYLSCIFSVPASDEELEFRLQQNKLELERIELLPGSTNIRGTVRVLNLSYHKIVYVRTTLDGWQSHFDQRAEYVPGYSDGETDRFSFQLILMPPFPPEGMRVEFCLCYESSIGIFWANNGGMNYVLLCHQRGGRSVREKEEEKERESEENNQKGKKSCLKTIIKQSCADSPDMISDLSEQETSRSVENKKEKTQHEAENRSENVLEESCKTLVERRNKRRAARLADCFSNRDAEVQLVQPVHAGKSKSDLNVVLPIPQSSIPLMTNISSTRQECKILSNYQNTLTPVAWGRNISSPSPSDTNTSEIISGTRMGVPEKEKTEDVSKELLNDDWKDSRNGTDSLDNKKYNNALDQKCLLCTVGSHASQPSNPEYDVSNIGDEILSVGDTKDRTVSAENRSHQCFRAMESPESDPTKPSPTPDPSNINEVLSYKCREKWKINFEPHTIQESESVCLQWRPGGTEGLQGSHLHSERFSNKDEAMLLPEQGDTAHVKNATEQSNSKPGDKDLFEECTSCTVFVDTKVKGDKHRVVKDTLTLSRIGNKSFTESTESLERQQIDDIGEPMKKKEYIEEENENGSHIKRMSWSECSDKALMVQENKLQDDEESSHRKHGNTEIWISFGTNVCVKAEPHKQAECPDKCYGLEKEQFSDSSEKQRGEILSVENREYEKGLKTEDQGIYVTQSKGDEYIDKELHKFQNSPETCLHPPNLCTGSHTSSPSGNFTCTASLSEGELLFPASYKGFESEETLRYRVAQDLHDQGVGTEFSSSFSRTASPSVSKLSSWLLIFWAKISNLSSITGAIVCAILFIIFVTAYLHDLPVCLAIYLLSVCWWCRHGMKKDVTRADSVD